MTTYNVFPITPPLSPTQLTAYKTLRLTSLQVDPQAFSSHYARELAFTEVVWRQRLDAPFKQTVIASVALDEDHHGVITNGIRGEPGVGEGDEWIGTASIIGPSGLLPSVVAPFIETGVDNNWEMYAICAMWVHPAHRSKGIGKRLVNACLEWARSNVDSKFSSENRGEFEKVVVLLVYDDNIAGRALYSGVGFTDLEGVSSRDGERWMLAKV